MIESVYLDGKFLSQLLPYVIHCIKSSGVPESLYIVETIMGELVRLLQFGVQEHLASVNFS